MAYVTGAADSLIDLVAKIKTAAESAGWITNYFNDTTWHFRDPKADGYYTIRVRQNVTPDVNYASYDCLFLTGNTGYDSTALWNAQPGNTINKGHYGPVTKFRPLLGGPYTKYHVFVTDYYLHIAVEVIAGTYAYMFFGSVDKDETIYTGGQYVAGQFYNDTPTNLEVNQYNNNGIGASYRMYPFDNGYPYYSNSFLHFGDVDDFATDHWASFADVGSNAIGKAYGMGIGGQDHPNAGLLYVSYNQLNDSIMLVPHTLFVRGAQNRIRYAGKMRDFAVCAMNGLAAGDTLKYGDDEYVVFPCYRKGTDSYISSLNQAYAFKKVA